MCMDCFSTMSTIEIQRKDRLKSSQTCSTCADHEETEDFSDCLCICVLDGLEKGKNSSCKNWR